MNIRRVSHSRCTPKRDGVALVITVFLLVLVIAFAAFAIDVGYILLNQNRLQTAADSAAFAGASSLGNGDSLWHAYAAAKRMSRKNSRGMGNVLRYKDVSFGRWDARTRTFIRNHYKPNAIRVVVRRSSRNRNALLLFFAPMLGHDTAQISATAIASVSKKTPAPHFRFLLDGDMFDTDIRDIEDLAGRLRVSAEDLISDGDRDGFLDIPAGEQLELPTGQRGDEAIFDRTTFAGAFPFTENSDYTMTDFLAEGTALQDTLGTRRLQDVEWSYRNAPHRALVGKKVLDPVPGTDPVKRRGDILSLADNQTVYLSPVFKGDASMAETDSSKYGAPAANLQGERRGLIAFKIMSARYNPAGRFDLPLVTIEVVDPSTFRLDEVTLDGSDGRQSTVIGLVR